MFDREALLAALDDLGRAARSNGERLELAICRGSALMLASNFRFATEDVDVAELGRPWPTWFAETVAADIHNLMQVVGVDPHRPSS